METVVKIAALFDIWFLASVVYFLVFWLAYRWLQASKSEYVRLIPLIAGIAFWPFGMLVVRVFAIWIW